MKNDNKENTKEKLSIFINIEKNKIKNFLLKVIREKIIKPIDHVFGREGFKRHYGAYPRFSRQAYFESFLRTVQYTLILLALVFIVVSFAQPENLTISIAMVFSGIAGLFWMIVRKFASRAIVVNNNENNQQRK